MAGLPDLEIKLHVDATDVEADMREAVATALEKIAEDIRTKVVEP